MEIHITSFHAHTARIRTNCHARNPNGGFMPELIVCSKEKHPLCEEVIGFLREQDIPYREIDIRRQDVITDLKARGCTALEPPILLVSLHGKTMQFFTNDDLFWDGRLIREAILDAARP